MLQKNIKAIKGMHILGETEDGTVFSKWQIIRKMGSYLENLPLLRGISGSLYICAVK